MFCTFLAVTILGAMTLLLILYTADEVFLWDIFPPNFERIIIFVMGSLGIILGACVIVSIMINFSIIAIAAAAIERKLPVGLGLKGGDEIEPKT